jgi:perosamine synthetase
LRRRLAILGGTTTWSDCVVALRYLATPSTLVSGEQTEKFEESLAREIDVSFAYTFWAGRVGLFAILKGLGIGKGDEVLVPVPTHVVVPNAVRYTGAKPIYVDCRLDDYNMDLARASALVTDRTRALILQHTFGIPADLDAALDLAKRRGLHVIEDCVHSLGARYRGRPVGSYGRAAFFSIEETKIISSTMGGVAVTGDPALATKVRRFQASCAPPARRRVASYIAKLVTYHVLTQPYLHYYARPVYELLGRRHPFPRPTAIIEQRGLRPPNYDSTLGNAQAALALRQLRRLDKNVAHRRRIAETYRVRLESTRVRVPHPPLHMDPAYVRYPVWVEDRAAAVRAISKRAVAGVWFESVLSESETPEYADYETGTCPNAELSSHHLVNLPTHLRVTVDDADAIATALSEVT